MPDEHGLSSVGWLKLVKLGLVGWTSLGDRLGRVRAGWNYGVRVRWLKPGPGGQVRGCIRCSTAYDKG